MSATNLPTTLNNIIGIFASIAAQHKQINSFGYGPIFDIEIDEAPRYPLLWVEPQPSVVKNNMFNLKLKLHLMDLVQTDASNRNDVHSDTFQTLLDIKAFIRKNLYWDTINIIDDSDIEPFYEKFDDATDGWAMTINLQVEWDADVCTIPGLYPSGATFASGTNFFNVSMPQYLPLAGGTLTGPLSGTSASFDTYYSGGTNLIDIINQFASSANTYTTSAYLSGSTIWFNRNDLANAYSVDLSAFTPSAGGSYWTSGSTGNNSIKAINGTGLDATGDNAVAIGNGTLANGEASISIGYQTIANGKYSFVGGENSIASGDTSFAFGSNAKTLAYEITTVNTPTPITIISACTITSSDPNNSTNAFVFSGDVSTEWAGYYYSYCSTFTLYDSLSNQDIDCSTLIDLYYDLGTDSTYIVDSTISSNTFTSISGNTFYNVVTNPIVSRPSIAIGTNVTASGIDSIAIGSNNLSSGNYSFSTGRYNISSGDNSYSEGDHTKSINSSSHSEGAYTTASGLYSHAEGASTTAGDYSHAEGVSTTAIGNYSHSEGRNTKATGYVSHSEGDETTAGGNWSSTKGQNTKALGMWSFAGGKNSTASGDTSFVYGSGSIANGIGVIVLGNGISGTTDNTTYVNKLNIKNVPTGSTVNNLGIDSNGNVIIGSTATTSFDTYTTGGTYSNGTAIFRNNTGGTFSVTGFSKFSYTNFSAGTSSSSNSNTLSKSVLIPANTLTNGALNIKGRSFKTGSSSFGWLVIYVNTSNSLSGAIEIGRINNGSNNTIAQFSIDRTIPIQSGSFTAFIINTTIGYEELITNAVATVTIDWTKNQYIILAVQANSGTDTLTANFLSVNQF